MFIEIVAIFAGMLISYFLKDIQFLSLEFPFLGTGLIYPDFLLIFIIFFALYRNEFVGIWVGFFGGILEDGTNWIFDAQSATFTPIIGIHSLVYSLVGFSIGHLNRFFERRQISFTILLVLATVIFTRFLTWSLHGIIDKFNKNYPIVGPAFYTSLLAPLWYSLLGWAYRISK